MNDASTATALPLHQRGPVTLGTGAVAGAAAPENEAVSRFLGIPYAAPPTGALRWRPPQPAAKWRGVRDATAFAPACLQPIDATLSMFGATASDTTAEDCLYLNVWTGASSAAERRPVMVWIHGGGFRTGHAGHRMYNGVRLAEKGVVFVSFNYRLNVLGGFAHPLLGEEAGDGASGNYALMDQIAALRWVKDNITAFDGDPGNVTIFGESAGGRSVSVLMVADQAKGLFHKGICQSGALRDTGGTLADRERLGIEIAARLGCDRAADPLAALRAADWRALIDATAFDSNPFVDGRIVADTPEALYAAGKVHDTPLLIVSNADEAALFAQALASPVDSVARYQAIVRGDFGASADAVLAAYPAAEDSGARKAWQDLRTDMSFTLPARRQARWLAAAGRRCHLASFSRIPPWRGGKLMGAHHGAEIPYVFGGGVRCGAFDPAGAADPVDRALSEAIMSYWVRFAATGDPNGGGLPDWPPYDAGQEPCMVFGDTVEASRQPGRARLDVLEAAMRHYSGKPGVTGL